MIDLDLLAATQTVVTHAACPDGMAAAILLRDALPKVQLRFIRYDSAEHRDLKPENGLLFVDIAPYAERDKQGRLTAEGLARVEAFRQAAPDAVVLDHHPSARQVVALFGEHGVFGDNAVDPTLSGAALAYREVWAPLCTTQEGRKMVRREKKPSGDHIVNVTHFASLAGIRDTWCRDDVRWLEACAQAAALVWWPAESWFAPGAVPAWEGGINWGTVGSQLGLGRAIYTKHLETVRVALASAARLSIGRLRCVVFHGDPHITSDAADTVGEDADVVVGFTYIVEDDRPTLKLSVRSRGDFRCDTFAEHFGGGGHPRSAGLRLRNLSGDPHDVVRGALYLAKMGAS